MKTPVITIRGEPKRYGRTVAVDDFTLEAQTGEMDTQLGLNCAGEITLIRCSAWSAPALDRSRSRSGH
jgi:ABC-type Na+ transport system ATPase subunit NatA